jgi:AcrR family transcriptional regulator
MTQPTDGPVPSEPRNQSNSPLPSPSRNGDVIGTIRPATEVVVPRTPTHLSREQILDATAACLQEFGYDGTTIRRIAKQLDCAVGSIYRYFDDKRALLAAVVQRRFEPVVQRIEAQAPPQDVADLYAQIASEQPELYRLMFWLSSIGKTTHTNTLPTVVRGVIDGWAAQLDDRPAAEHFWSQLHGAIMQGRTADGLTAPAPGSQTPGSRISGTDGLGNGSAGTGPFTG